MRSDNSLFFNFRCDKKVSGEIRSRFSPLVDSRVGIINAFLERKELMKYGLYSFQNLSAQTKVLFSLSKEVSSGGLGIHSIRDNALLISLMESIERYCLSYVPQGEIFKSRFQSLPTKRRVSFFDLYSAAQYKSLRGKFYNPSHEKINWVKVFNAQKKNEYIYWPASLVYVPYELERRVAEQSSSGVASHLTISKAILNGLLELIERDAIALNFLKRLNPPEIDIRTIKSLKIQKILKKIRNDDFAVKVYKLYSDVDVPIFLSIIFRDFDSHTKKFHFGIGASATLSSDASILKSLQEALFTYYYSRNMLHLRQKKLLKIRSFHQHFLYYQDSAKFSQLLFKSDVVPYLKSEITKKRLFSSVNRSGLEIYYKDITTNDVASVGVRVVRVVVPGLIELNSSYKLPRRNARRFKSVPSYLGLRTISGISRLPHPFP
jgi:ribosomal protein S12 methylthiotransferase accessory factor